MVRTWESDLVACGEPSDGLPTSGPGRSNGPILPQAAKRSATVMQALIYFNVIASS